MSKFAVWMRMLDAMVLRVSMLMGARTMEKLTRAQNSMSRCASGVQETSPFQKAESNLLRVKRERGRPGRFHTEADIASVSVAIRPRAMMATAR